MPSSLSNRCFRVGLFAALLVGQVGCIALNVPSQRFADPGDSGGVLGHWQKTGHSKNHGTQLIGPACGPSEVDQAVCLDGGPLGVDPFDPSVDMDGQPIPPEIPWPRFHPVPTRPVFGPSPSDFGH